MLDDDLMLCTTLEIDGREVLYGIDDIIEFEEKEYAILIPLKEQADGTVVEREDDEESWIICNAHRNGESVDLSAIEDDEELARVAEYMDNLLTESDDDVVLNLPTV